MRRRKPGGSWRTGGISRFTQALCHLMAFSPAGTLPDPTEVMILAHAGTGRHLIELESFVTLWVLNQLLVDVRVEVEVIAYRPPD